MNNLNSIVDYLKVFNNINKRPAQEPRTMAQEPRNMYQDGQLVQNTADGSRPGYGKRDFKKNPPWNKGLSDPSKFYYSPSGEKIYKSTRELIKKMESTTVPFYSERKQMWGIRQSKQEGKKQSVIWKKKKSDINKFIKKQSAEAQSRIEEARTTGQTKRIANEKKYVKSLENWTDNWFKQNKFDNVRDIDKSIDKLKKDFAKAKIVKPEGVVRAAAVEGFPNIPDAGKQLKKGEAVFQKSYYRKRFLNNVLDNNPLLEKRVNNYFDYVIKDKSSLKAIQEGGYKNLQQLKIAYDDTFKNMDDIMFLLSQEDTGLYGAGKYDFLNKRFKNYDNYSKKVNQSGITYLNNIKKIEDTLGPRQLKQLLNGETSIIKFMIKQQNDLAKIFDVKNLPIELRFSLDHNIGVADISRMDKSQMAKYINSYIGTTVKRNTELGLRGFATRKPKLIKNINAGIDVKDNLAKLNKITKIAYPETLGKNPYKMVGGKVDVTKSFIFPKTQEQLFTDYFKTIAKTKKGSAAIKAQHGSLKNLLETAKTAKGPGKLKALSALVAMVGAGAVYELGFSPTEVQAAEAQAGETGVVDKAKSWPVEHPWLTGGAATGAAATTKKGRSILGKAFRTLGTPLAGPLWAGWNISDELKKGKSLTEAVTHPLTGMELAFPSLFKENVAKITKSPLAQKVLGLGGAQRFLGPIGMGITAVDLLKKRTKGMVKESDRMSTLEGDEQEQAIEDYAAKAYRGYAEGGIMSLKKK